MNQSRTNRFIQMALVAGLLSASALFGQSLADLARQEREKTSTEHKPAKVYTNEDISELPGAPSPPSAKEAEKKPESEAAAKEAKEGEGKEAKTAPAGTEGANKAEAPAKSQEELEKEYRERFAKLRDNLAYEQKKMDVLQREWNLMQTQYYSDPNVEMREELFRGKINQQTADIEQEKAAVAKAEQAVADLEEELRKNGLPAGWAR